MYYLLFCALRVCFFLTKKKIKKNQTNKQTEIVLDRNTCKRNTLVFKKNPLAQQNHQTGSPWTPSGF